MRLPLIFAFLCCILTLLSGCGKDNPLGRLPISGKVTFQGQPLATGDIEFAPVDPLGKTKAGATIVDGEYSIEADAGLVPGIYVVRIFSSTDSSAAAKDVMPGMQPTQVARERIPPQYNVNSRLRCEVKSEGDNVHDFAL